MDKCLNISNFTDDVKLCLRNEELIVQTAILITWYKSTEVPLATIGILGHVLSICTLVFSPTMQTSSFLYHKILTLSEFSFCLNAVIQALVGRNFALDRNSLTYATYESAFYLACISRAISSVSGYTTLYMTLLIANDRLFAVVLSTQYYRIKTKKFAYCGITVAALLATFVHSWSSVIEYSVRSVAKSSKRNLTYSGYQTVLRSTPQAYITLRDVKNVYNSIIRFSYPIVLATLTVAVILGFWHQHRLRNSLQNRRKLSKRDLNLFSLLLSLVFLAFLQVIPSELKRIFDVFYHKSAINRTIEDSSLSYETRLEALEFSFYGLVWTKVFANFATYINRSFNFYLYFCFNGAFRTEFLKIALCHKSRDRKLPSLRQISSV